MRVVVGAALDLDRHCSGAQDQDPRTPPTNLTASVVGAGIQLSWSAPADLFTVRDSEQQRFQSWAVDSYGFPSWELISDELERQRDGGDWEESFTLSASDGTSKIDTTGDPNGRLAGFVAGRTSR